MPVKRAQVMSDGAPLECDQWPMLLTIATWRRKISCPDCNCICRAIFGGQSGRCSPDYQ